MARGIDRNRSGAEVFAFLGLATPQNRLNAQDDFAWTERFGDVIVRPKFQANDAIDFLRLRRQHHDRNVPGCGIGFQNFANFETRHFRQHQIENDKGRFFRACLIQA